MHHIAKLLSSNQNIIAANNASATGSLDPVPQERHLSCTWSSCVSLKKSLITIEVTNLAPVEYLPFRDHLFFTKLPRSLRANPRKQYEHHFTQSQCAGR